MRKKSVGTRSGQVNESLASGLVASSTTIEIDRSILSDRSDFETEIDGVFDRVFVFFFRHAEMIAQPR